jgi:GT2 family glycosyltransferase
MSEPVTDRPLVQKVPAGPRQTVWIVILTYNGLEDTRKCLATVEAAVGSRANADVVSLLVDNGSTDQTEDAVRAEFPWCPILRIEQNAGPAAGNNRGIEHALSHGADWVLLLNNDTTVRPEIVDRLVEAARANPTYAIVGPVINYMSDPDAVMTDAVFFNRPNYHGFFERKEVPVRATAPPVVSETDVVNGCCMMIAAPVFRAIGLFDERIFIYHDETDFCLRAWDAGFRCGVIDHQLVWHKGSSTSKDVGKRMARYYDSRNLYYVLRKHKGATRHGRPWRSTAMMYLRYNYYRYCVEREHGFTASADAVIDGICDAIAGRGGRFVERRRPLAPAWRGLFEALRHRPRLKRREEPV